MVAVIIIIEASSPKQCLEHDHSSCGDAPENTGHSDEDGFHNEGSRRAALVLAGFEFTGFDVFLDRAFAGCGSSSAGNRRAGAGAGRRRGSSGNVPLMSSKLSLDTSLRGKSDDGAADRGDLNDFLSAYSGNGGMDLGGVLLANDLVSMVSQLLSFALLLRVEEVDPPRLDIICPLSDRRGRRGRARRGRSSSNLPLVSRKAGLDTVLACRKSDSGSAHGSDLNDWASVHSCDGGMDLGTVLPNNLSRVVVKTLGLSILDLMVNLVLEVDQGRLDSGLGGTLLKLNKSWSSKSRDSQGGNDEDLVDEHRVCVKILKDREVKN